MQVEAAGQVEVRARIRERLIVGLLDRSRSLGTVTLL